jgi:hypothetical protein
MTSCNKPDVVTYSKEGAIYMPKAAVTNSNRLLLTDTAQTITFGAAYGGLNYPNKDITVSFKIDSSLIGSYNVQNSTSYVLLPAFSYEIPSLTGLIKSGQTGSNVLSVKVITNKLDRALKYILPITISSVSSGSIDSSLHTAYFTIDTIQRLENDITALGRLAVSKDNDGGANATEGSVHLVDNDINTKFLVSNFPADFWVQLQFPSTQIVGAYTLTSGNDSPERDPKDWNLEGSNDGSVWTELDNRPGEVFSGRNQTKRYEISNPAAYTYYRLNITANQGNSLFQVSELITYP